MRRRTAGFVGIIVGVVLITTVLSAQLFTAANAFERLSDTVRPVNTAENYAELRQDLAGLQAIGNEFAQNGTRVLAAALGQTEPEAAATFASQFPATARALIELPAITSDLTQTVETLDAQRANFAQADAIPTKGTSTSSVPWFILITGIIALLAGLAIVMGIRGSLVVAAVVGLVLVAVPLISSLPQKSADADTLNENLESIYAPAQIAALQESAQTLSAMGEELATKLVPTLSTVLNVPPAQVQTFLASNFPSLATALPQIDTALEGVNSSAALLAATADDYETSSRPQLEPIAWIVVGSGIALVIFSLLGLSEPAASAGAQVPRARRPVRIRRRPAA